MSTLTRKTPSREWLHGKLYKNNKETNTMSTDFTPFMYKTRLDETIENQPIKGMQMGRTVNEIFSSDPIKFSQSDEVQLEEQPRRMKVVSSKPVKNRRYDMRTRGTRNKELYSLKRIALE